MLGPQDITFQFEEEGLADELVLNGEIRQNLYLMNKEAITNIVKHANATEVSLSARNTPSGFQLSIRDNGQVEESDSPAPTGSGLGNMQRRAEELGGTLTIQRDNGFQITYAGPRL